MNVNRHADCSIKGTISLNICMNFETKTKHSDLPSNLFQDQEIFLIKKEFLDKIKSIKLSENIYLKASTLNREVDIKAELLHPPR